jgi:hypothetical protein
MLADVGYIAEKHTKGVAASAPYHPPFRTQLTCCRAAEIVYKVYHINVCYIDN